MTLRHVSVLTHFCKFSQSAHIAYFFPHKLAFSTAILILFAFYYLGLLGFVTSTTWLPTEWQQSIHVSGPMWNEMGTIFPRHIWCLYGFQKMPHKTDMPNYDTDTTGLAGRAAFVTGSNEIYDNSALTVSHY